MGLREDKKQRQRQEIVRVALELFRERGYDETRVRDIAARADISEATFFNYFSAKDLVLDELALTQVELFRETIAYQLGVAEKTVPERIVETMRAAAVVIAQDREFQAVLDPLEPVPFERGAQAAHARDVPGARRAVRARTRARRDRSCV